jgi:hypothetical protein
VQNYRLFLYVVLHGRGTCLSALGEEHRLRVFGNGVLRRILGRRREEVTGGWRKQRNEKLHNLYSSPNIIQLIKSKTMTWTRYVIRTEEKKN